MCDRLIEEMSQIDLSRILLDGMLVCAKVVGVLIVSILLNRLLMVFVDGFFLRHKYETIHLEERRAKTLSTLLKSVVLYIIYFFAGIMILQILGVETAPIVATAGLASLALGFGAQNLVRDVITGFFIIMEDHFAVGDYITTAGVSGIVEEMGLRITKIRDFEGQLHVIPNSRMEQVTNFMGDRMRVMLDVHIAYEADMGKAFAVLEETFANMRADVPSIVEGPDVLGVQELSAYSVVIRVVARSEPMAQWSLEREIRKRIKLAFDNAGIEIPYPRRYVIIDKKNAREGEA